MESDQGSVYIQTYRYYFESIKYKVPDQTCAVVSVFFLLSKPHFLKLKFIENNSWNAAAHYII